MCKSGTTSARPPSVKKIIEVVSQQHGIKASELSNRVLQRHLAEVRGVIDWLVVKKQELHFSKVSAAV